MPEAKKLDLKKPVRELCEQYPELVAAMDALGFHDILKPGMLSTAGRFVTIPMGAKMKGIGMDAVLEALREKGFEVTGGSPLGDTAR